MKYINSVSVHVLQNKKKCSLFVLDVIYFFDYCQEVLRALCFATVFGHEKVMEFILLNFVATR